MKRHLVQLGAPRGLTVNVSRLRKTYENRRYLAHDGDVAATVRGRKTMDVGAEHYFKNQFNKERHERAVAAGARELLEFEPRIVSDEEAAELEDETWIGGCTDPMSAPWSVGSLCPDPVLGCLPCPNAAFHPGKLPALLRLRGEMLRAREILPTRVWVGKWRRYHRRLEHILARFSKQEVARAQDATVGAEPPLFLPFFVRNDA